MKKFILGLVFLTSMNAMAMKSAFEGVTPEQPVCYGREYEWSHLKKASKQTVQKIQVKLSKIKQYDQKAMEVEITLKGEKNFYKNYRAFFSCNDEGRCQIDCDGGSAHIQLSQEGHLVLTNHNFMIAGGCGEEEEDSHILTSLKGGDDVFKLVRLPAPFCQNVRDYSN